MSPQPASPIGAQTNSVTAHRRRLIPLLRRPTNPSTSATRLSGGSTSAQHFDLARPQHFNSWAGTCLDPATNPNPPILEGLEGYPGRFDRRDHALRNSRSKVPCKVPPEIQVSRCSRLPYRQNLALDHCKPPDPGQNIVRTFGVFYDSRVGPDASFASRASASAAIRRLEQSRSAIAAETNAAPCTSRRACTGALDEARKTKALCRP